MRAREREREFSLSACRGYVIARVQSPKESFIIAVYPEGGNKLMS